MRIGSFSPLVAFFRPVDDFAERCFARITQSSVFPLFDYSISTPPISSLARSPRNRSICSSLPAMPSPPLPPHFSPLLPTHISSAIPPTCELLISIFISNSIVHISLALFPSSATNTLPLLPRPHLPLHPQPSSLPRPLTSLPRLPTPTQRPTPARHLKSNRNRRQGLSRPVRLRRDGRGREDGFAVERVRERRDSGRKGSPPRKRSSPYLLSSSSPLRHHRKQPFDSIFEIARRVFTSLSNNPHGSSTTTSTTLLPPLNPPLSLLSPLSLSLLLFFLLPIQTLPPNRRRSRLSLSRSLPLPPLRTRPRSHSLLCCS